MHSYSGKLWKHVIFKKLFRVLGSQREKLSIHRNADTQLALSHAEGTAQVYLIADIVLHDQGLNLFNDLTGSFDMAG